MMTKPEFKVGDRVKFNGGYEGTVIRTKDSPGSAWMGSMIEVRGVAGVCCILSRDAILSA